MSGKKGTEVELRTLVNAAISRARAQGADEKDQLYAAALILQLARPEWTMVEAISTVLRFLEEEGSQGLGNA